MRTVLPAARRVLFVVGLVGLALAASAAGAADKRVIQTNDADYTGFDYSTLKNVTINQCQAACLGDNKCAAFTYNPKATWCFMKSDFGALASSPGAIAGRVVAVTAFTPTLEKTRLAELAYLPSDIIDEARAIVGDLKNRYPNIRQSYAALRTAAVAATRANRTEDAAANYAQALVLANEDPAAWLDFARLSLARTPQKSSDQIGAVNDATAAAVDAYLRADSVADRTTALTYLGQSLARREIWKAAIASYKASLALTEVAATRAAYEKAVAEHGFRVVDNTVEADSAVPQICVRFSDDLAVKRPNLQDFVTVEGGDGLAIEPQATQICVGGVKHGVRYTVRLRAGLPAANGETLLHPVEISMYVRDRAPWVGFAGSSYILPAGPDATIPISSVNTDTAKATIYRIGDRGLASAMRDGTFLATLSGYTASDIADHVGEKIWEGEIGIQPKLNETVVTAIPIGQAVKTLLPGAYVLTAQAATGVAGNYDDDIATQWFIITDLGMTTLSGNDGIHVMVRSLATAQPIAGAKLHLVAVNNEILGDATTDPGGYAKFAAGLARGTGGRAPQMVSVENGTDYSFIDITRSAFDLTDRGVSGRPAPKAIDAFLTPERGIYRPGEVVHLTALVRDARAAAVTGLPLTLTVDRPDGVESTRAVINDQGAGGYSKDIVLDANAMRGAWRVKLYADPKGDTIAETTVLVEDFEPERLAFDITSPATTLDPAASTEVDITARYLYGAPAPNLAAEGEIALSAASTVAGYPTYSFGLAEEKVETVRQPLTIDSLTDPDGKASFDVQVPDLPKGTHPFNATLDIRLADTNGRAVERTLSLPVKPATPMIGIHPLFSDDAQENSAVAFDAIYLAADGKRAAAKAVKWKLERIETDYQWYRSNGKWNYERISNASRVDGGTVDFTAAAPTRITGNVAYGDYRLTVEDDAAGAASSYEFYAGWYRAVASSDTPDTLEVSLDKDAYKVGDTAHLKLDPRFAGVALVSVIDDRLITMKAVDVPESGATVDLPITADWGPGAYVTATLYRPMDLPANRMPSRALGLAWAKVAPGDHALQVSLGVASELRPKQAMTIPVAIANLPAGTDAYVTVAAVDVGILNLTNFKAPAPDDWYFGQRMLGMDIRDVYGLLIDRTQGALGTVRSGGDAAAARLGAPPPTQKLLAFYSGIVKVGADGKANVSFDLPEFNGSVRVMAMAWSKDAVGHAAKDVIVRDPVVVTASIPRFLAVGDTSRLLVEVDNVAGAVGNYQLAITTGKGLDIGAPAGNPYKLDAKQKISVVLPIKANTPADYDVRVAITGPSGESYGTSLTLGVRPPGLPTTTRTTVNVAANNGTLTIDPALTAKFVPGTGSVAVSLGGAGPLDVAGILAALDRYPYGCVEQITSRAMPLVYLDDVAVTLGIAADQDVKKRVQLAIAGVLADQAANGAFGLWGPQDAGNDLWLDSYVTDFITRAADKNYEVPALAKRLALDNLANKIAYATDFSSGGQDIAYALYVLARNGRAAIGDLRYYSDSKLNAFSTPLAKAQVGAAMALYGDRQRADKAFQAAMADLDRNQALADRGYRADYGSNLRDGAAVLTLAAETKSATVDVRALATRIATTSRTRRYMSTQEDAWMLLAAAALIKDSQSAKFQVDGGATVAGALFRTFTDTRLASGPVKVTNLGTDPLVAVVAATGVPVVPDPAGGNGLKIERAVYDTDGKPVDLKTVKQNDRFVVVLNVTADNKDGGHMMVSDPIPAGFEIENPDLSINEDATPYSWLTIDYATHTEARTDRFLAAVDRSSGDSLTYGVAYTMRAVSPGVFTAPAATVEDMYRPERNARTATGKVEVVGPTR